MFRTCFWTHRIASICILILCCHGGARISGGIFCSGTRVASDVPSTTRFWWLPEAWGRSGSQDRATVVRLMASQQRLFASLLAAMSIFVIEVWLWESCAEEKKPVRDLGLRREDEQCMVREFRTLNKVYGLSSINNRGIKSYRPRSYSTLGQSLCCQWQFWNFGEHWRVIGLGWVITEAYKPL